MDSSFTPGKLVKLGIEPAGCEFPIHDVNNRTMDFASLRTHELKHNQIGIYIKHIHETQHQDSLIVYETDYEIVLFDDVLIEIQEQCLEPYGY